MDLTDLGSGPCDTAVDLAAKRNEIDGFRQKRVRVAFHGFSPGIGIAIGRDYDDPHVRLCHLKIITRALSAGDFIVTPDFGPPSHLNEAATCIMSVGTMALRAIVQITASV